MSSNWLRQIVWLSSIMLCGCEANGFDIELHMPIEVTRVELTIDLADGVQPRRVKGDASATYAIDLDKDGKATISAAWPITNWHRTFLVTPSGRLQKNYDFQVVDSGWKMGKTTTRTANGVTSKTKLDGSKFWMEIKKLPNGGESQNQALTPPATDAL